MNVIDENTIQIYGRINGFAYKQSKHNRTFYQFSISFFNHDDCLIKITINPQDETMSTIEAIILRIQRIYHREFEKA